MQPWSHKESDMTEQYTFSMEHKVPSPQNNNNTRIKNYIGGTTTEF